MSASTAIGMVSESLQNLLVGEMTLSPAVDVTLLAPDENTGSRGLNLFLYKIEENTFLKNQDWQAIPGTNHLAPPPLSLKLRYLMIALAPNDSQTQNAAAHAILGEGMRVLYEFPVVPTTYLPAGLSGAREEIRVMLCNTDMHELGLLWSAFSKPFRPSVTYEISVAQIDPLPATQRVMAPRVRKVGTPDIRSPFQPPVLTEMTPGSGVAGTTATFKGHHLTGWRVIACVSGSIVLNGVELNGDTFTLQIPATLPTGFHEIRIDISSLHRSTYFFEVTP